MKTSTKSSKFLEQFQLRMLVLDSQGSVFFDNNPHSESSVEQLLEASKADIDAQKKHFSGENGRLKWKAWQFTHHDLIAYIFMIWNGIAEIAIENELRLLRFHDAVINELVENAYEGLVVVDANGNITKCRYEKLLGIKEADVVGKPVSSVIENTRLHEVIKTGRSEIGHIQTINGHDMIASRIPVIEDGKVIGAVGTVLFKDVKEVKTLAKQLEKLESTVKTYQGEINRLHQAKYSFENIITKNPRMQYLLELSKKAADSHSTVLIEGESGTGKEYFSHAIHKASYRRYGPFVQINCAAIPKELIEAELFGYEEGAFTGAVKGGKLGKFELANGGTLFLDEIGTLPLDMQAKLLRVLEEREYERIGGSHKIALDIRVIAATNETLSDMVAKGRFREDLYYRLNVIRMCLPPLRERREDISILAEHIVESMCKIYNRPFVKLTNGALEKLQKHDWPGNVRELRNALERALTVCDGQMIYTKDLPDIFMDSDDRFEKTAMVQTLSEAVEFAEKQAIANALEVCSGNKSEAAKLLGIHRTGLHKKIKAYNL